MNYKRSPNCDVCARNLPIPGRNICRDRSVKRSAHMFDVTHNAREFDCPKCAACLCFENWTTEYGDPLTGMYDIDCPDCGFGFAVEVKIQYKVTQ